MDDDELIFDQLDSLGARDFGQPYHQSQADIDGNAGHTRRGGSFAPHEGHIPDTQQNEDEYFDDDSTQLDSFDQALLAQPDHDSRHGQAALGRARLSLPPARGSHLPAMFTQQPPASQRPDLSRFAFDPAFPQSSSPSPQGAQQFTSSPDASQRRPALLACKNSLMSRGKGRDQPSASRSAHHFRAPKEPHLENQAGFNLESTEIVPLPPQKPATVSRNGGPPVVQGISLVSTRELPDRFRSIFPFPLLNAVQSKCFETVYNSNDNFVVSAPTGSGKTAILELAICRLINGFNSDSFKIVYQAPTKSLCSERQRDWQAKFGPLDLQCAELTGDTDYVQLRNVQHASIIITTPEKWDSMTRKWKDHQKLMQMVKLFLIDEVHILKEERGATLEAVVSRMKSIGSDVRFVALSATVPNLQDVAAWIGKDSMNPDTPASRQRFGEEFRPVRLTKHVCGYQGNSNDFAFDKVLNARLTDIIAKWSQRKPLMVFCSTRKSCMETAKLLSQWWSNSKNPKDRYWTGPRARVVVGDRDLRETIPAGVAFHHAGLKIDDRTTIERAYLHGEINVICCTSTLAVGVNLPCHMVIIKSTVSYQQGAGCKEYSDLEVMQMLGRAGRPQFDDSAVAVIMTRLHRVEFYQNLVSGQEVLESSLHRNLIDHLNSEVGLGTVTDLSSAKKWLTGTFLYVRLKENSDHYRLTEVTNGRNLDERLEAICKKGIASLEENDLVRSITPRLQPTEFGDAMARYYIQFDTMRNFLALPPKAKISEILSALSQAAEFREVRFRMGEKPVYRELNKHSSIKFPIPIHIDHPAHKVSLIIQSVLGAIELATEDDRHHHEYNTCRAVIFQQVHRLIRCIIDCQLYLDDAVSVRNALMLARSFGAQVWDDSPLHIKQLAGIGLVGVRKLVAAGIKSIEELEGTEASRIEVALSRQPPFGHDLLLKARAFPRLRISLQSIGQPTVKKEECVSVKIKAEIGFINEKLPETFNRKPVYLCTLVETSDGRKAHFARVSAKKLNKGQEMLFTVDLTTPEQSIRGYVMCEEVAGTQRSATLNPRVPNFMFPSVKATEENAKQQEAQSRASNTAKRRDEAATRRRPAEDDEFGDASINDDDLAAIASKDRYVDIDELDNLDEGGSLETDLKKNSSGTKASTSTDTREPRKLENGKWACKHQCKDKTQCKHLCCREGLDKKPKPPKSKDDKKEVATDPKQMQLGLGKTTKASMKTPASVPPTPSSTASGKNVESKGTRDLNRLHDSVNSSAQNVTTVKYRSLASNPTPVSNDKIRRCDSRIGMYDLTNDGGSSDYGLESLEPDDLLEDFRAGGSPQNETTTSMSPIQIVANSFEDDEMLDLAGDPFAGHSVAMSLGQTNHHAEELWSTTDYHQPQAQDDSTVHESSSSYAIAHGKGKGLFVTGDTSSTAIDPNTSPTKTDKPPEASKRPLDEKTTEGVTILPPNKKSKSELSSSSPESWTRLNNDLENVINAFCEQETTRTSEQPREEAVTDSTTTTTTTTTGTRSKPHGSDEMMEWVSQHLGFEDFEYIG